MRWPRGRFNGQRIGGFIIKIEINLTWWGWYVRWDSWLKMIHAGPLAIWFETAFEKH